MNIQDKVVIITGASSGIGLACARLFAKNGAKLALVSRPGEKPEKLAEELLGAAAFSCDMTKTFEVKNMIQKVRAHFGRIDVLVNNAGQGYDAPVEKMDIDVLRYIFALTVVGPTVAMQEAIPIMKEQGGGVILNVSSGTALMNLPEMAAYASMKVALAKISLTARADLKNDNITVCVIYPYITLTDFEKNTIRHAPVPEGQEEFTGPYPPDPAEYVAGQILEGIQNGTAEIYAHDWMKK
jgi:NAD(P)-dependent dehydrogenase (short-subunit alcohol dehydrogenase family)